MDNGGSFSAPTTYTVNGNVAGQGAVNYDPLANIHVPGDCCYVSGCLDICMSNYDATACSNQGAQCSAPFAPPCMPCLPCCGYIGCDESNCQWMTAGWGGSVPFNDGNNNNYILPSNQTGVQYECCTDGCNLQVW